MMLSEFLNFNRKCPICNEPLSLYMHWLKSCLFQAQEVTPNLYDFKVIWSQKSGTYVENDSLVGEIMQLEDLGNNKFEIDFSNGQLQQEAKKPHLYFFWICNPNGITKMGHGNYQINMYKSCYYRSSPSMEFVRFDREKKWNLCIVNPDLCSLVNKSERFAFKSHSNAVEKVYTLGLDYETKETLFWYYAVTDEEKKIELFKPKVFEKQMPLLRNRPNFENKEKLLERFDSWIIMS